MLTIGQLAAHAGVTVRAVRHYHAVGLLGEPPRTPAGYRAYRAADVVALIRIRTLADAGVPLARVRTLLEASPEAFAAAVEEIDAALEADIRRLERNRRRIARLAAGDSLALPQAVVDYLERLAATGAPAEAVEAERDAWILAAAGAPDRIDGWMREKQRQLDDPRVARFYRTLHASLVDEVDEAALEEAADLLSELSAEHFASADAQPDDGSPPDRGLVGLLDIHAEESHPVVARLRELMEQRGWTGWADLRPRPEPDGRAAGRRRHDLPSS